MGCLYVSDSITVLEDYKIKIFLAEKKNIIEQFLLNKKKPNQDDIYKMNKIDDLLNSYLVKEQDKNKYEFFSTEYKELKDKWEKILNEIHSKEIGMLTITEKNLEIDSLSNSKIRNNFKSSNSYVTNKTKSLK